MLSQICRTELRRIVLFTLCCHWAVSDCW